MLRRRGGFSLLEMLLVIAVMAVVAAEFFDWRQRLAAESVVRRTVDGMMLVDEAVYSYRIDNPGTWPTAMADLAAYLGTAGGASNGVGNAYSLDPRGTRLAIQTTMLDADQARAVARAFPLTASFDAATFQVTFEIPVPGHESAHANLLHLDGSRAMRGDFDVGGFDIAAAGDVTAGGTVTAADVDASGTVTAEQVDATAGVTAETVEAAGTVQGRTGILTGTVSSGGSCTAGGVGLNSGGKLLTCQGGTWTGSPCEVTGGYTARAGPDHWLILQTTCGTLPGILFEGSNA